MRVTRAFWASFGAGMSIVVTGAVLLLAVSTVVAFRGWPGADRTQSTTPAAMLVESDSSAPVQSEPARAALVVPDMPARARRAAVRSDRPTDRNAAVGPSAAPRSSARGLTSAGAGRPADGSPDGGTTTTATPKAALPGDGVRQAGATLGGGTADAVGQVGDAVAPVSPTLDKTVDAVGTVAGDTVEGITTTIGKVVDGIFVPRR